MTDHDLGALRADLAQRYGDDAAQDAMLAILTRHPTGDVAAFAHRVAYRRYLAYKFSHVHRRHGARTGGSVEVKRGALRVVIPPSALDRAVAREALERVPPELILHQLGVVELERGPRITALRYAHYILGDDHNQRGRFSTSGGAGS